MTSTDIEIHAPQTVALSTDQLRFIANTEFVPRGVRGNLPAIMACVATGRELGIGDMAALKSIHIIDGTPSYSAELMVMLVRRRGHSISGQVNSESATVTGKRVDNGDEMSVTWTTDMAKRAGLLGKSNWAKYTESMLWARAASQLCRMLFADCFAGSTYTPEELEDGNATFREETQTSTHNSDAVTTAEPGITGPQKKKANVLVGQLRDAEKRLTTEDVYAAAGKHPGDFLDEAGELHWSPLRDSLTKSEARVLIDRLEEFDRSGAESVIGVSWAVQDAPPAAALSGGAEPGGLTLQAFKQRRIELGIDPNLCSDIADAMFDAGVPELSDEQRFRVLAEAVSRSQVPA